MKRISINLSYILRHGGVKEGYTVHKPMALKSMNHQMESY